MNKLKQRLIAICKPKPAPWKRVVLWVLSLLVATVCVFTAWAQVQEHSSNYVEWLVIGLFGILSIAGIIVAALGDDLWVAIFISDVD